MDHELGSEVRRTWTLSHGRTRLGRATTAEISSPRWAEARQQQAAASEVLALMGESRVDLQVVFDTVVEHATKLCRADAGHIYIREGGTYRVGVAIGGSPEYRDLLAGNPIEAGKSTLVGKVALERRTGAAWPGGGKRPC